MSPIYTTFTDTQPFTTYRKCLPSAFLSKSARRCSKSANPKSKEITYERDIVCLPKSFSGVGGVIKIPRAKSAREFLARNGLIGKISLKSTMTEEELMDEIRSVFYSQMDEDKLFQFSILQSSGGGSKTLSIPSVSSSFKWSASSIAGKNSKSPIYILAQEDLMVWSKYILHECTSHNLT